MISSVAYVTGTRADFGLMSSVLHDVSLHFHLRVYATGMHLMPQFGRTIQEVEREFPVIPLKAIFARDTRESMSFFISTLVKELTREFVRSKPDIVFTLGDRPEMLATAVTCLYLGIPSAQFHGGDKTYTVDEVARHAITKLSHLHFPATEQSARRIRKMGEDDWRIHVVGAPSLDKIVSGRIPTKQDVYTYLRLSKGASYVLVLQHPVSEEIHDAPRQMKETLESVKALNMPVVIIYPNADTGGRAMISVIKQYEYEPTFHTFKNIPYDMFLGIQKYCSVFVGNSSSAMIESSSFRIPAVCVGTRQKGRQHGKNVLWTGYDRHEIYKAIVYSLENARYRKQLRRITNPWGDGKTGKRVVKILQSIQDRDMLLTKQITY